MEEKIKLLREKIIKELSILEDDSNIKFFDNFSRVKMKNTNFDDCKEKIKVFKKA